MLKEKEILNNITLGWIGLHTARDIEVFQILINNVIDKRIKCKYYSS